MEIGGGIGGVEGVLKLNVQKMPMTMQKMKQRSCASF